MNYPFTSNVELGVIYYVTDTDESFFWLAEEHTSYDEGGKYNGFDFGDNLPYIIEEVEISNVPVDDKEFDYQKWAFYKVGKKEDHPEIFL